MREVSVRILYFALDLARTGGLDEAALVEGLPSLAKRDGVVPPWFDWSDFTELWDRLERGLGGPEGFARVARRAIPTAYPEVRAFAAFFVSPASLFTFMAVRHMRTSFRNVEVEVVERSSDGQIRWRETVGASHRPCDAFHRASRTFAALIPLHLGLPEGEGKLTMLTPRAAEHVTRFPAPPPLATRGRLALSSVTSLFAAQLDEAYARIADRVGAESARAATALNASAAAWADKLALSPRQREVFALLVEARANKEIAGMLRCSERNVEFHVGRILRAAQVTSRAELLVKVLGTKS